MDVEVSDSEPKALNTYATVTNKKPAKEWIGTRIRPTPTQTPKRVKASRDTKMNRAKKQPVKPAFVVVPESGNAIWTKVRAVLPKPKVDGFRMLGMATSWSQRPTKRRQMPFVPCLALGVCLSPSQGLENQKLK